MSVITSDSTFLINSDIWISSLEMLKNIIQKQMSCVTQKRSMEMRYFLDISKENVFSTFCVFSGRNDE